MISFARGVPAPECLPVEELADCARAVLERDGRTILNYGPVGGYGPLREWLAEQHGVDPGRVFVTNGSLEGLNVLLTHFAGRGRILVEAPTYDRPLKVAARARVGYFVLTPELAASYEAVAANVYLSPALVGQATVFEFLRRGNLEPNLERVCGLLRERRDAMLDALDRELNGGAAWTRP